MNLKRTDIFNSIENAKEPNEVIGWIKMAITEGQEPEFDSDVLFRVRSFGLERLSDLTVDNPTGARELILGPALDLCISEDGVEGRHYYSEYREIILKWLEQYPAQDMVPLRGELLKEISSRLKVKLSADLVWLVSVLGYREDILYPLLKNLSLSDSVEHPVRDAALSTLCSLGGLSEDEKESFRVLAESRLAEVPSIPLFSTLMKIGSLKSVDTLLRRLIDPTSEGHSYFSDISLTVLSEIAEKCSSEDADKIWKGIITAVKKNAEGDNRPKIADLAFNSGLLKRFDSESVTKDLCGFLKGVGKATPNDHVRYILYLRLSELTGINQLNAFNGRCDVAVLKTIKADCVRNTANTSRQTSHEDRLKESAWEAVLRLGVPDLLDWFEGALGEDSPYMRGRILNFLACFHFDRLPDMVGEWLFKRTNREGGDAPEIFYTEPSLRLVGHSSDSRALEWLLDLGMTYRGQVPTSGADTLSVYCLMRIRGAEDREVEARSIISALLLAFDDNWMSRIDRARQRRMLAAAALEAVSAEIPLSIDETQEVVELFLKLDVSDELFALCPLARIAARAKPDVVVLNRIKTLAMHDNKWAAAYGVSALESIGACDDLELLQKNGLLKGENSWKVVDAAKVTELGAFLLGKGYIKDQESTSHDVAAVVENGDWRVVSQLLRVLSSSENCEKSKGGSVSNALLTRILDRMCFSYSETNLFQFLARLNSEMFLETEWSKHWSTWSTESRISLIHATTEAVEGDSYKQISQAIKILGGLERDPVRDVRQEARYAWLMLHPESFSALIKGRATSKQSIEADFRLASEALWAIGDEQLFNNLSTILIDAPERRVREACSESIKIRRERSVAQYHLNIVESCEADNASMLGAWKHGSALIDVGHSDHLDALFRYLGVVGLSPNKRHWVKLIADKLEKKIKEKKRKENPDWSPPGAQTIRKPGKIKFGDVEREALFVIRIWESEELGDNLNWDGDGWFTDGVNTLHSSDNLEISFDDGSGGTAMFLRSSFESFSFSGIAWTRAPGE